MTNLSNSVNETLMNRQHLRKQSAVYFIFVWCFIYYKYVVFVTKIYQSSDL